VEIKQKLKQNTTHKIEINETKKWFFEKINKLDKALARLTKKKRENSNKTRNVRDIKSDATEIQRTVRAYYE